MEAIQIQWFAVGREKLKFFFENFSSFRFFHRGRICLLTGAAAGGAAETELGKFNEATLLNAVRESLADAALSVPVLDVGRVASAVSDSTPVGISASALRPRCRRAMGKLPAFDKRNGLTASFFCCFSVVSLTVWIHVLFVKDRVLLCVVVVVALAYGRQKTR
jgi:hypothetical protein